MKRLPGQFDFLCLFISLGLLFGGGCREQSSGPDSAQRERGDHLPAPADVATPVAISDGEVNNRVIRLFDGESLAGWEIGNFGGEGDCHVSNGELTVEMGSPISGVICTREDLPTNSYEISLEAKREQGIDFFCALTFPVDDSHCTFIVGGWAGAVVGISCIDGKDASSNETKTLMKFDDGRWYKIRVRVANERIQCWIDDQRVVNVSTVGREFTLRAETLMTRPLGICTFETVAVYRHVILKPLDSSVER